MSAVPSKDYRLQYESIWPELGPEIERVFHEEDPTLGASVDAFEQEFARHHDTPAAVGVGSGTDALYLALRALGVGKGDEVVTAANTFIATITAIVMTGATPRLADPDPRTMNVGVEQVRSAMTERTAAVVPIHLYGRLADMDGLTELAATQGVAIVEGAAQAHGAADADGRRAGSFGEMGCFSFHPGMNLGAFGDAGMITCRSEEHAERLRVLRNLGRSSGHDVTALALNSKLDTLQAAVLRVKLRRLEEWNERRREIAARYLFELAEIEGLTLPEPAGAGHVFHLFVVRTQSRDDLRRWLLENGVRASLHYPVPPHLQPLEHDLGYRAGDFPIAEECARTVLSLPVSPELTDEQIARVCRLVREFHA